MYSLSKTEFDFIIVGGGSAGATLAARLSENPAFSVCLLEAGTKDKNPLIHIPFGLSLLARIKGIGWGYSTAPQTQLDNRELHWPRGKTLGGSSSINAMIYIRGVKEDYDYWEASGAEGWGWESVLPYFKKAENQQHGESEFHGNKGPLCVNDLRHKDVLSKSFVEAASEVNEKVIEDFNLPSREGLGFYQVTQKDGQRCSAAKAYLTDAIARPNLTIITQACVDKIIIENKQAKGVKFVKDGQVLNIFANKEVIMSSGAINTPQVLMLSGIGPEQHLSEHGIECEIDLPGVGQNLQDHLDTIVQHRCDAREGYAVAFSAIPKYIKSVFQYLFKRKGLFSSNIAEAGGFVKSQYAEAVPDIQYHFLPAILLDHGRKTAFGYGYGLHVCCLYPKSSGEIRLQSSDPRHPAVIDPKYLEHEDDQKVMIDGVKKAREILAAKAFTQYQSREIGPGPEAQSDAEILSFIRKRAETIYHPIGTCKMGRVEDDSTVVDSELKVKGIANLRVIDASVMPRLVGGNTNAPTIMIAERAADLIKTEYAE
ncbi:GMC family oxidoreductase [Glaciecola petra]|uniref:Choline dehydrogenase n=1 Tax=Glaciecola petra TaxID=3075602 RepID=A0ABU2ZNB6_9ALTE|nr:choline dehydrogenase [Aestuariibacter sp. P117]MDT0594118.1 choline dehydrogenase [Aestuariibacter sp. P117]